MIANIRKVITSSQTNDWAREPEGSVAPTGAMSPSEGPFAAGVLGRLCRSTATIVLTE